MRAASLTINGIDSIDYFEPDSVDGFSLTEAIPCKHFGPRYCHGIVLKIYGESTYCFQNSKELVLDPGKMIFLPQGVPYSVYTSQNGGLYYANFYSMESQIRRPVLFKPGSLHKAEMDFLSLLNRWRKHKTGHLMQCYSILYSFLSEMERNTTSELKPSSRAELIQKKIEQLEDCIVFDANFSVTYLAKECRISEAYFRRLFYELYGMSPKRYITDIRINRAKSMLEYSDCSILCIAEKTGYSDIYQFSKAFKCITGCSPTEYRNMNK